MNGKKPLVKTILATLFWVAVWQILSSAMDNPLLFPGPVQVLGRMGQLMADASFWQTLAASIGRILLGAAIAMVLGILLALLSTVSSLLEALIAPVMAAIQAAPVASFAILVLIWLERDLVPVLICAMMVLPVIWSNVCAGIRAVDSQLLEMGNVFRLPRHRVLTQIYVPTVLPYFRAACGSALGLGWKAGIAAEVLTVPKASIGRMISESKLYLLTEDLFAWTLLVVILSLLLQMILLRLLKRRGEHA